MMLATNIETDFDNLSLIEETKGNKRKFKKQKAHQRRALHALR
jgi:hypothetical protein